MLTYDRIFRDFKTSMEIALRLKIFLKFPDFSRISDKILKFWDFFMTSIVSGRIHRFFQVLQIFKIVWHLVNMYVLLIYIYTCKYSWLTEERCWAFLLLLSHDVNIVTLRVWICKLCGNCIRYVMFRRCFMSHWIQSIRNPVLFIGEG